MLEQAIRALQTLHPAEYHASVMLNRYDDWQDASSIEWIEYTIACIDDGETRWLMTAEPEARYAITQIGLIGASVLQSLDSDHEWLQALGPFGKKLNATAWAVLVCRLQGERVDILKPSEMLKRKPKAIGERWSIESLLAASLKLLNSMAPTEAVHSDDFRSVRWFNGELYSFSPTQAACIEVLWRNWKQGTPVIAEHTILDAAGSDSKRLRDVFDKGKHPAWNSLVVSAGKGTYRLAEFS